MVKLVLDSQQVKGLSQVPPGALVRLDVRAQVESSNVVEDGYVVVVLDVLSCAVEQTDDGNGSLRPADHG